VDGVAEALLAGGVVVLPTDTVYGLAARASDPGATARLFAAKRRTDDVPLAVLCASADQALALASRPLDPALEAVADRWWPGPLTLVVTRREGIAFALGEPATTIGLRVPADERLRAIAERVGPVAATSANRHGEPVVTTAEEARAVFGDDAALVVDGGHLEGRSSTVVDTTVDPWKVLREGPITADEIFATARHGAG
jgi:tRNA threonylcarbamoyl adenosine modification protein (Sua5/YciO/YrdC/YwlC family)